MKWAFALLDTVDLKPDQRLVLLALCWDHTDSQGCFPSQERIAAIAGYRSRKVRDVLKDLEELGLIRRRLVRAGGKFAHTEYKLFGTLQRQTGAGGLVRHRRHKKADGDQRQTGADYRGTHKGDVSPGSSVEPFPTKKKKTLGVN